MRKLWRRLLDDEMAARRWGRAVLMALATGGVAFGDQVAELLESPGAVRAIKLVSVVAGFLSLAINLGERNAPAAPAPLTDDDKTPVGG